MLWVKTRVKKLNRRQKNISVIISIIILIGIIIPFILTNQRPSSGASLFSEWSTKGDFESNLSTGQGATTRANIQARGSASSDDSEVKLSSNIITADTSNFSGGWEAPTTSGTNQRSIFKASSGTLALLVQRGTTGSPQGLVLRISRDNGRTWQTNIQISGNTTVYPSGYMDGSNNLYVVYATGSSGGNSNYDVGFAKLTYSGGSDDWSLESSTTIFDAGASTAGTDAVVVKDSTAKVWAAFRYYDGTNYFNRVVYSDNDGAAWSNSIDLDSGTTSSYRIVTLATFSTKLAAVYGTNESASPEIRWRWRNDADAPASWQAAETIEAWNGTTELTSAVDNSNVIHIAYRSASPIRGKYAYYNGSSWTIENALGSGPVPSSLYVKPDGSEVYLFYSTNYFPAGRLTSYRRRFNNVWENAVFVNETHERDFNKVLLYDADAPTQFEDDSVDAADVGSNDIFHSNSNSMISSQDDAVYFGLSEKTFKLLYGLSQAGVGGAVSWEYSKGAGNWQSFSPDSGANNFTSSSGNTVVRFWPSMDTAPGDWVKDTVNGQSYYWIRAQVATDYSTAPIGDRITSMLRIVGPTAIASSSSGIYVAATDLSSTAFRVQFNDITQKNYLTIGTIGGSGVSDVGLRTDAGGGVKANWSSVTFNAETLASGQAVKFGIRTSDDGATWSNIKGRDGNDINWTTGSGNYFGQAYGESIYSSISNVAASRYLDVVVRSESSGNDTPILNDVRANYDVIDSPGTSNLSTYRSDGTTQISVPDSNGGFTNETTVKVSVANMQGLGDSTTVTPEVEAKPFGTAFDGTGTTLGSALVPGSTGEVTLSGLTVGSSYHFRVRLKDNLNRVSGWTNFNNDNKAFTIEQTAPTGSVSINGGATYTTSTSATLDLSSATDPGSPASGLDKMMVSEDSSFSNALLGDTTWQNYSASRSFTLSSGDATKTVYAKVKDKAGNTSTNVSDTITLDTSPPANVSGLVAKDVSGGNNTLTSGNWYNYYQASAKPYFSWSANTDPDLDATNPYKVYFGTSASATAQTNGSFQTATNYSPSSGLTSATTYYLKVAAKDNAGQYSAAEASFTYKYDNVVPDINKKQSDSSAFSISASQSYTNKVRATWPRVLDDSYSAGGGVSSYKVYRKLASDPDIDGSYTLLASNVTTTDVDGNYYYDDSSVDDQMYNYKVKATDAAGNESGFSVKSANGYIADLTAPSTPSNVAATAQTNGTSMVITWDQSLDNVGVSGYQVYFSLNPLASFPTGWNQAGATILTNLSQYGLVDNTTYYYKVRAFDAAYNYSNTNNSLISDVTPDVTSPNVPSWVTLSGASGYSASRNDIEWSKPTDLSNDSATAGSGVSSYRVYRSTNSYDGNAYPNVSDLPSPTFGAITDTVSSTASSVSYSDTSLSSYAWYAYRLRALDSASTPNVSSDSSVIWVRTRRDTQPVGVSGVSVSTPTTGNPATDSTIGDQITITFSGGASKNDTLDFYEVYRATSSSGPWTSVVKTFSASDMAPVTSGTISSVNYNDKDTASSYSYADTSLNDNTAYYYKVRAVDIIASGPDAGTYDSWTATASSITTKDTTAPLNPNSISVADLYPRGTISNIVSHPMLAVSWPHISSRVGHPTSSSDDTFTEYRLYRSTDGSSWGSAIYTGVANYYIDETVADSTTYYYKVTTADGTVYGGGSSQTNESSGVASTAVNPSSLDKVAPALLSRDETVLASQATINLSLDEAAEAIVQYGLSSGSYSTAVANAASSATPAIVLKKLTPGSTYYYRVIARDANNNKLTSSNFSFTTPEFKISNVVEDPSINSASIKWRANADADSFVKYTNADTNETRIVADDEQKDANNLHSLILKGLSANTRYNYQIVSKNDNSNRATKTGFFRTEEFTITDININTTASTAAIVWKTNAESDSFVDFGKNSASEEQTGSRQAAKSHQVILRKLKPGTKYKFRVASRDAYNNISIKSDKDSILETKPFRITDIDTEVLTNSATISWKTNIEATSLVEYKSSEEAVSSIAGEDSSAKDHNIKIRNLKADTVYSFKIKSRDIDDNIAESEGILSLKTKSLSEGYNVNPQVSKLDEMELTATSAKINWTTEGETSSWVDYGTTEDLGKLAGNDTLTVDHIVEINNLTPGTIYYYKVKGEDSDGNGYASKIYSFTALVDPKLTSKPKAHVTNDSATITFKTNTDTDTIVEYGLTAKYGDSSGSGILAKEHTIKLEKLTQDTTYHYRVGGVDKFSNKVMSNDFTFKTDKDTKGPTIREIRNEVLRSTDEAGREKISVIVSFITNEQAISYIEYAEGISMATYNKKTRENTTLNLSHSALIEELNPASTYHYRIVTKDKFANTSKSPDKTILTPKESESVLQKIIKVLEDTFSWVNNIKKYIYDKN